METIFVCLYQIMRAFYDTQVVEATNSQIDLSSRMYAHPYLHKYTCLIVSQTQCVHTQHYSYIASTRRLYPLLYGLSTHTHTHA